jgi:hypothetical protein
VRARIHARADIGLRRGAALRVQGGARGWRILLARVLSALPERWLAPLAGALATASWLLKERWCAQAQRALAAALGGPPGPGTQAILQRSLHLAWADRLLACHARSTLARRLAVQLRAEVGMREGGTAEGARHPSDGKGCLLLLGGSLGWGRVLARCAPSPGVAWTWLEQQPSCEQHAAWLENLGRVCCADARAVDAALRRGQGVRLLLLLPDAEGRPTPWLSPDLAPMTLAPAPPAPSARDVLQRAVDVVAVLARARPDLVDWTGSRWRLRPAARLAGSPPWTRWAPWRAAQARRRGPAPRGAPPGPAP